MQVKWLSKKNKVKNARFDISGQYQKGILHLHKIRLREFRSQVTVYFLNYLLIFFNWDTLHERLKIHFNAWSYKKKKDKKIKAYRKSL